MSKKLLEGVRVVELATFIAAATCGRFLADMGADVIKIEAKNGDPVRYTAPSEGRPLDMHENTTWELENANKRGLSIDTRKPEGKEVLFKLLETADILVTNWREQALQRSGLDYETLKVKFPKLVYAICTGYGQAGPDKDLPGFDFTAFFARGGYLETLRQADGKPMSVIPGLGDHNVGMNLAAGCLAALYHAKMTGEGEKVETSLYETAVFNMGMMVQAAQYTEYGTKYPIMSRNSNNPVGMNAFLTKDNRYIMMCFPDYNTYFKKFMAVLGRDDLANDEHYYPIANLQANNLGPTLYDTTMAEFGKKTAAEWMPLLKAADLPYGLAQSWEEILEDPQAWENHILYSKKYPNGNTRTLVCQPVRCQEMGQPEYNLGPMIGEHGDAILTELGYTDEERAKMKADGIYYVWEEKA